MMSVEDMSQNSSNRIGYYLVAFHTEIMGGVMYFHQALKQQDSSSFMQAVMKKVNGHMNKNTGTSSSNLMSPKCGNCAISMGNAVQNQINDQ